MPADMVRANNFVGSPHIGLHPQGVIPHQLHSSAMMMHGTGMHPVVGLHPAHHHHPELHHASQPTHMPAADMASHIHLGPTC